MSTSNGRMLVSLSGSTCPCFSWFGLESLICRSLSIWPRTCFHVSLHWLCIFVLCFLVMWLHWNRWSPFLSHGLLQAEQIRGPVPGHMFMRRHRLRLNWKSGFDCLFLGLLRSKSKSPIPSLLWRISSMLLMLSLSTMSMNEFVVYWAIAALMRSWHMLWELWYVNRWSWVSLGAFGWQISAKFVAYLLKMEVVGGV